MLTFAAKDDPNLANALHLLNNQDFSNQRDCMITLTVLLQKFSAWRPVHGSDDKDRSDSRGESVVVKLDALDAIKKELPPLLFDVHLTALPGQVCQPAGVAAVQP